MLAYGFEQAIIDTRAMLKTAATLTIVSHEMIDKRLKVVLKITNNTGHKLPSSYPSRRVYIHFSVEILYEVNSS